MGDDQDRRYVTVEQFAERLAELGLSFTTRTIRDWINAGKVRAIRPGGRAWYIPVEEIARLLAGDSEEVSLRLAAL